MSQNDQHNKKREVGGVNIKRRNFIKLGLFGAGAFLLGKVVSETVPFSNQKTEGSIHNFKNFKVVEQNGSLGFFDRKGNQILLLERDSTEE